MKKVFLIFILMMGYSSLRAESLLAPNTADLHNQSYQYFDSLTPGIYHFIPFFTYDTIHTGSEFPFSITAEDAQIIIKYFSDLSFYQTDLSDLENNLREKFKSGEPSLAFEFNYLRGYFALARYDRENHTQFSFEAALIYIRNNQGNIFRRLLADPILDDLLQRMRAFQENGDLGVFFDTLAGASPQFVKRFLNSQLIQRYGSTHGGTKLYEILSYLSLKKLSSPDTVNFNSVHKLILLGLEAMEEEVETTYDVQKKAEIYNKIVQTMKSAEEAFQVNDQPLMARFYSVKIPKVLSQLEGLNQQHNKEANIIEDRARSRNVRAKVGDFLRESKNSTEIYDENTGIRVSRIQVTNTTHAGNVFQFGTSQKSFVYRLEIFKNGDDVHGSYMQVLNQMLEKGVDVFAYDDLIHIPHELQDRNKYSITHENGYLMVRVLAPSECSLLFQNRG